MKYIKTVLGALFATALFATTAFSATNAPVATGNDNPGQWTFGFAGSGASDLGGGKFNSSAIGGDFSLGHTGNLVLPLEIGLRQSFAYSDANGADWRFSTKVYSDWTLIKLGNFQFDAGGNIGINYGNQNLVWTASPEVVARIFLKKDVDLFGRVEYPFDLNKGRAQNVLVYTIGVRVVF